MVEEIAAHIGKRSRGNVKHDSCVGKISQCREKVAACHDQNPLCDFTCRSFNLFLSCEHLLENIIYRIGEKRGNNTGHGCEDNKKGNKNQQWLEGSYISDETLCSCFHILRLAVLFLFFLFFAFDSLFLGFVFGNLFAFGSSYGSSFLFCFFVVCFGFCLDFGCSFLSIDGFFADYSLDFFLSFIFLRSHTHCANTPSCCETNISL